MSAGALYVYGVVGRADRELPALQGVDGAEVETVEHDGLAAITSRVQSDTLGAARELRAHWRVLQQACEQATVLPVRFGTILESEEVVRETLLRANEREFGELLTRLRGCVQMTVKGSYLEERAVSDIVRSSRTLAALAESIRKRPEAATYYDRIRLGEAIAAAVADRRAADAQHAFEALGRHAVDARAEETPGALDAFNLAFLIKRSKQQDFSEAVRAVVDDFDGRIDVRYVGPLPLYSFTEAGV